MLILSRQLDESINIGDEVVVTVLEIKGGQVRLGIEAPRDISVHREEIYNQIREGASKKKTELAMKASPGD